MVLVLRNREENGTGGVNSETEREKTEGINRGNEGRTRDKTAHNRGSCRAPSSHQTHGNEPKCRPSKASTLTIVFSLILRRGLGGRRRVLLPLPPLLGRGLCLGLGLLGAGLGLGLL
jgi:hypothetical protein